MKNAWIWLLNLWWEVILELGSPLQVPLPFLFTGKLIDVQNMTVMGKFAMISYLIFLMQKSKRMCLNIALSPSWNCQNQTSEVNVFNRFRKTSHIKPLKKMKHLFSSECLGGHMLNKDNISFPALPLEKGKKSVRHSTVIAQDWSWPSSSPCLNGLEPRTEVLNIMEHQSHGLRQHYF